MGSSFLGICILYLDRAALIFAVFILHRRVEPMTFCTAYLSIDAPPHLLFILRVMSNFHDFMVTKLHFINFIAKVVYK